MFTNTLKIELKETDENYSIILFWGNLDSVGLTEKRKEIMNIVDEFDKKYLVLNFAELNFLNSESIGFLIQINEKLLAENKQLIIVDAKKNVLDVLEVIGLLETLPYYKKMDDFIKYINK